MPPLMTAHCCSNYSNLMILVFSKHQHSDQASPEQRACGADTVWGCGVRTQVPTDSAAAPLLSPLQLEALPYDERPLPAVHKQPGVKAVQPEESDRDLNEAPRAGAVGEPEPLTEKALREAGSAVDALGEAVVRGKAPGGRA